MAQIIEVPGQGRVEFPDGMDDAQIVSAIQKLSAPKSTMDRVRDSAAVQYNAPLGALETATALGSGFAGAVAGGFAGMGQGIKNLVSPGMPAGDRVRQVSDAMTYEPRTALGRGATNVATFIPEQLARGADYVGGVTAEATGSPAVGAGVNTALQFAPQLLARGARAPVQKMVTNSELRGSATASRESVRDGTLSAAREEGYVVPPSAASRGGSFFGNRVEGIAGKAALNQETVLQNQPVTNRIARREAGLSEDTPISEKTLENARAVIAEPYREVAALSPRAADALDKLKDARAQSKLHHRHYDVSQNPEALAKAEALDSRAAMLEKLIDHEAGKSGVPGLPDRLKEARKNLAKNYDVERALNLGTGDVDALVIGRMLDKRGEAGMSGGMLTIGKFAQAFRPFAREGGPLPTPGKGEGLAAAALGIGGHAGGLGWLPMGLPLAAGPFRSLALSPMMQTPRAYGPGLTLRSLEAATQNSGLLSLLPALGDGNQ